MSRPEETIIIIGAGPKAMAIAAKSVARRKLGLRAPRIHIIEKHQIGANWKGTVGFTNGKMELGTSPEKDIGFPYQSAPELNREMWKFSWSAYLIETGEYSSWIDRGKPAPTHEKWAAYLWYVSSQFDSSVTLTLGDVTAISIVEETWEVTYRSPDGAEKVAGGTGLVVTGPGKTRMNLSVDPLASEHVYDLETFWKQINAKGCLGRAARVAIVGAGENAASCLLALNTAYGNSIEVDVVSPFGSLFSRGESHFENRVYSDPQAGKWGRLSLKDRKEFISRTDLGVFSLHAMELMRKMPNVNVVPGRALSVRKRTGDDGLELAVSYAEEQEVQRYDKVILATGFDQVSFIADLLTKEAAAQIRNTGLESFTSEGVSPHIRSDLSLGTLTPKLHLPMVAGLTQGPGYANLSSLGRLSDKILEGYIA